MKNLIYRINIRLASPKKYIKLLRKKGVKIGDNCEIYKDVFLVANHI